MPGALPEAIFILVKAWRAEGMSMKQVSPRMHEWYDADAARSVRKEPDLVLAAVPADKV